MYSQLGGVQNKTALKCACNYWN